MDPRLTRILELAEEVKALSGELKCSVHIRGGYCAGNVGDEAFVQVSFHGAFPPGVAADSMVWNAYSGIVSGQAEIDGVSVVSFPRDGFVVPTVGGAS